MDFNENDLWPLIATRYGLEVAYDIMMSWADYCYEMNPPTDPEQIEYRDRLLLSRLLPTVRERAEAAFGEDVFAK